MQTTTKKQAEKVTEKGQYGSSLFGLKGALSGLRQFFGSWKAFQNDEKCFLFHVKSSFRSQNI